MGCYLIVAVPAYIVRKELSVALPKYASTITQIIMGMNALSGVVVGLSLGGTYKIGLQNFLLIVAISTIWPFYQRLSYFSNIKVEAGVFYLIQNTQVLYSAFFAYFIVDERLNVIEMLAMVLLIASSIIAKSTSVNQKQHFKYIAIAFLVPVMYGFGTTLEKLSIDTITYGSYILIGFSMQFLFSLILKKPNLVEYKSLLNSKFKPKVAVYAVLYSAKGILLTASFATGKASLTNAVASFTGVLILIAAYFFLNEKEHMVKKLIATVIGVIGILIIRL
jgi:drug/metabolite transporter (DMT)-like permease